MSGDFLYLQWAKDPKDYRKLIRELMNRSARHPNSIKDVPETLPLHEQEILELGNLAARVVMPDNGKFETINDVAKIRSLARNLLAAENINVSNEPVEVEKIRSIDEMGKCLDLMKSFASNPKYTWDIVQKLFAFVQGTLIDPSKKDYIEPYYKDHVNFELLRQTFVLFLKFIGFDMDKVKNPEAKILPKLPFAEGRDYNELAVLHRRMSKKGIPFIRTSLGLEKIVDGVQCLGSSSEFYLIDSRGNGAAFGEQLAYGSANELINDIKDGVIVDLGPGTLNFAKSVEMAKRRGVDFGSARIWNVAPNIKDPEFFKAVTEGNGLKELYGIGNKEIEECLKNCKPGSWDQLPFQDNEVDRILSLEAFPKFCKKIPRKGIAEIYRVLKPGGIARIGSHMGDDDEEIFLANDPRRNALIKELAIKQGFKILDNSRYEILERGCRYVRYALVLGKPELKEEVLDESLLCEKLIQKQALNDMQKATLKEILAQDDDDITFLAYLLLKRDGEENLREIVPNLEPIKTEEKFELWLEHLMELSEGKALTVDDIKKFFLLLKGDYISSQSVFLKQYPNILNRIKDQGAKVFDELGLKSLFD